MNIEEQHHGAVTVLKPSGPLSQDDAEQFQQCFTTVLHQNLGRVVVDISAVPYVDSRGLEVLVEASSELAHSGHALKLCGVNDTVREVLDLTGLGPMFEQFEDVHSAVRSFL